MTRVSIEHNFGVASIGRNTECGAALLLMLLVVILASSSFMLANLDRNALWTRQQVDTREQLSIAREALLDYAVLNADRFVGRPLTLPCPDIDASGGFADGVSHRDVCGGSGETVIGRLPWRTLGLAVPQDSAAACLWYAVSGTHKDAATGAAAMTNADSNGQIVVRSIDTAAVIHGATPDDRLVAVILAAQSPLNGQVRNAATPTSCADVATASNYLDVDINSGINNAVLDGTSDSIEQFSVSAARSVCAQRPDCDHLTRRYRSANLRSPRFHQRYARPGYDAGVMYRSLC